MTDSPSRRTMTEQRLYKRIAELEAELAVRDRMLMMLFMEERDALSERGQDFFKPSDEWLADLRARARAEEGSGDG